VRGPLSGKKREAALPISRAFHIPGAESLDNLSADPCSRRWHRGARPTHHQGRQQRLHGGEVVALSRKIDLLDQSRNLGNIARALLEVPDIIDLADFDEGIVWRVGAGPRVVVDDDGQRACGSDLSEKLQRL